jgi:hypothetical protein
MTAAELVERAARESQNGASDLGPARDAARGSFRAAGGGGESLLSRLAHWVGEQLGRVFPEVSIGGGSSRIVGYVIIAALAIAAVRLLMAAAQRFRVPARPPPKPGEPRRPAFERARADALRLAERDPREALRVLYGALLTELGRRRGWRAAPGRTNWGFVRRLDPATPQGAALSEGTRLFEGRVYGDIPAGPADVRRLDGLAGEVLE